jgi:hypothetical protein
VPLLLLCYPERETVTERGIIEILDAGWRENVHNKTPCLKAMRTVVSSQYFLCVLLCAAV